MYDFFRPDTFHDGVLVSRFFFFFLARERAEKDTRNKNRLNDEGMENDQIIVVGEFAEKLQREFFFFCLKVNEARNTCLRTVVRKAVSFHNGGH